MKNEEIIEKFIQNEYADYVKRYKQNYYDVNYMNYEQWYKENEQEYNDLVVCDNCGEVVESQYITDNDFITEGGRLNICDQCIEDGYGA